MIEIITSVAGGPQLAAEGQFAEIIAAAAGVVVERPVDESFWTYARIVDAFGDPFRRRLRDAILEGSAVDEDFTDAHQLLLLGNGTDSGLRVGLHREALAQLNLSAEDLQLVEQMAGGGNQTLLDKFGLLNDAAAAAALGEAWMIHQQTQDQITVAAKGAAVNESVPDVMAYLQSWPDADADAVVNAFRVALDSNWPA